MALSLVSLNIEEEKHLNLVVPFLEASAADVVCVQELMEADIPALETACGPCVSFAPEMLILRDGTPHARGSGIFSRLPASDAGAKYYVGSAETVRIDPGEKDWGTHAAAHASIEKDGTTYRLLNVHGTWTPGGETTPAQLEDCAALLAAIAPLAPFVLVGDFNARRGGEAFAAIAAQYTDNIPAEYETSIDLDLHRAREHAAHQLSRNMVDGLFTAPGYSAKNVRLQFGVSDHAAVIATIEKTA